MVVKYLTFVTVRYTANMLLLINWYWEYPDNDYDY